MVHPGTATIAFCFRDTGEGQIVYDPPGARIGHNPVGGGPPVFEIVDDTPVGDLAGELSACPTFESPALKVRSPGGGLELANVTWSSAGHYLARLARALFLPAPLQAATVGTLGPIAGKPVGLSPFGIVLADCPGNGYYTYFCLLGD